MHNLLLIINLFKMFTLYFIIVCILFILCVCVCVYIYIYICLFYYDVSYPAVDKLILGQWNVNIYIYIYIYIYEQLFSKLSCVLGSRKRAT
jgi:hypothetical protein